MQKINTLQNVFTNICLKYSENQIVIEELWSEIKKYYSEKTRFYHTFDHIFDIYVQFFKLRTEIKDFETIMFSMFYHDIIYNPQRADNEEQSVVFMQKSLSKIGFQKDKIERCKEQILATKSHIAYNNDTNIFLDADLAILGQSDEDYKLYTQKIRQEYSFVSDEDYTKGRVGLLKHFLEMERIYKTEYFFDKFENQARKNIKKELKLSD